MHLTSAGAVMVSSHTPCSTISSRRSRSSQLVGLSNASCRQASLISCRSGCGHDCVRTEDLKSSSAQKSQGAVWRPRFRTPRASCAQTAHHTRVPRGSCCGTFAAGRKPRRGSSRCAAVRRAGAWPLRYTIHIGSAASGMYSREVVGWSERHACARSAGPRARRHGTGAVPHRPTWRCAHGPGAATGAARRSTQTLLSFCYHAAPLPRPALGDHPGGSVFGLAVTPRSRRPLWWLRLRPAVTPRSRRPPWWLRLGFGCGQRY